MALDNRYPITYDGSNISSILPSWNPYEGQPIKHISASLDLSVITITRGEPHYPWKTGSYVGSFMQDSSGNPKVATNSYTNSVDVSANYVSPVKARKNENYGYDITGDVAAMPTGGYAWWVCVDSHTKNGARVVGPHESDFMYLETKAFRFEGIAGPNLAFFIRQSEAPTSGKYRCALPLPDNWVGVGSSPRQIVEIDQYLKDLYSQGKICTSGVNNSGAWFKPSSVLSSAHILGAGEVWTPPFNAGDEYAATQVWGTAIAQSTLNPLAQAPWQGAKNSKSTFDPSGKIGGIILFPNEGWICPGLNPGGNSQTPYGSNFFPEDIPGIYFNIIPLQIQCLANVNNALHVNRVNEFWPNPDGLSYQVRSVDENGTLPWHNFAPTGDMSYPFSTATESYVVGNNFYSAMLCKWSIGTGAEKIQYIANGKTHIGVYSVVAEASIEQPIYIARKFGSTYVEEQLIPTAGGINDFGAWPIRNSSDPTYNPTTAAHTPSIIQQEAERTGNPKVGKFAYVSPDGKKLLICSIARKRTDAYIDSGTRYVAANNGVGIYDIELIPDFYPKQTTLHYNGYGYGRHQQEGITIWDYGYKPNYNLPNNTGWRNLIFETQELPSSSSQTPVIGQLAYTNSSYGQNVCSDQTAVWRKKLFDAPFGTAYPSGTETNKSVYIKDGVYDFIPRQYDGGVITNEGNWAIYSRIFGITRGSASTGIDTADSKLVQLSSTDAKKTLVNKFYNQAPGSAKAASKNAQLITEDLPGDGLFGFGSTLIATAISNNGVVVRSKRAHSKVGARQKKYKVHSVSNGSITVEGLVYINTGWKFMIHSYATLPTAHAEIRSHQTILDGGPTIYTVNQSSTVAEVTIPVTGLGTYSIQNAAWSSHQYKKYYPPAPAEPFYGYWDTVSSNAGLKMNKYGINVWNAFGDDVHSFPWYTYNGKARTCDLPNLSYDEVRNSGYTIDYPSVDITPTAYDFQAASSSNGVIVTPGTNWFQNIMPNRPYKAHPQSLDFINGRTTFNVLLNDFSQFYFTNAGSNVYVVFANEYSRENENDVLPNNSIGSRNNYLESVVTVGIGSTTPEMGGSVSLINEQTLIRSSPVQMTSIKYGAFGSSVDISEDGSYVAVGNPSEGYTDTPLDTPECEGAVYLYKKLGSNYEQINRITVPRFLPLTGTDIVEHVQFGCSVQFIGNTLLVGSRQGVYAYELDISPTSKIQGKATLSSTIDTGPISLTSTISCKTEIASQITGCQLDINSTISGSTLPTADLYIPVLPNFFCNLTAKTTITGNVVFGNKVSFSSTRVAFGSLEVASNISNYPEAFASSISSKTQLDGVTTGAFGLTQSLKMSSKIESDIIKFIPVTSAINCKSVLATDTRVNPYPLNSALYSNTTISADIGYVKIELSASLNNATALSLGVARLTSLTTTDSRQVRIFEAGKTGGQTLASLGQRWVKRSDLQNNDLQTSVEWVEGEPPKLD